MDYLLRDDICYTRVDAQEVQCASPICLYLRQHQHFPRQPLLQNFKQALSSIRNLLIFFGNKITYYPRALCLLHNTSHNWNLARGYFQVHD